MTIGCSLVGHAGLQRELDPSGSRVRLASTPIITWRRHETGGFASISPVHSANRPVGAPDKQESISRRKTPKQTSSHTKPPSSGFSATNHVPSEFLTEPPRGRRYLPGDETLLGATTSFNDARSERRRACTQRAVSRPSTGPKKSAPAHPSPEHWLPGHEPPGCGPVGSHQQDLEVLRRRVAFCLGEDNDHVQLELDAEALRDDRRAGEQARQDHVDRDGQPLAHIAVSDLQVLDLRRFPQLSAGLSSARRRNPKAGQVRGGEESEAEQGSLWVVSSRCLLLSSRGGGTTGARSGRSERDGFASRVQRARHRNIANSEGNMCRDRPVPELCLLYVCFAPPCGKYAAGFAHGSWVGRLPAPSGLPFTHSGKLATTPWACTAAASLDAAGAPSTAARRLVRVAVIDSKSGSWMTSETRKHVVGPGRPCGIKDPGSAWVV